MKFSTAFHLIAIALFAAAFTAWLTGERTTRREPETPAPTANADAPPAPRGARAPLAHRLASGGFEPGAVVFIRIFKAESALELWLEKDGRFTLFETYPICAWSGALGPKTMEGDGQAPEGFYEVGRAQLKPDSAYHRAFNLGFPNAYDRANGRTGSFLMVHGACVSIGCYAMTDAGIAEIYALVEAALAAGQPSVAVHAFPFRMTAEALAAHADAAAAPFWADLKTGHDLFEASGQPPDAYVCAGRYAFAPGRGCARITPWRSVSALGENARHVA